MGVGTFSKRAMVDEGCHCYDVMRHRRSVAGVAGVAGAWSEGDHVPQEASSSLVPLG